LNDTRCSPRQSPVSSCNTPANGTSTRGAAGGIRQLGWIQKGHGAEGPGSPATRPGAFLFVTSLKMHLPFFQLAEAIQHLGAMLCGGSLVALEALGAPGLCWQGNAVRISSAMETSEQESCHSIQHTLCDILCDQVSGSEVKGKSSSL